jgi:hypothetical protein
MALTLIVGLCFIFTVKNLRSDTWKQQRHHTIILISAIEVILILQQTQALSKLVPEMTIKGDAEGNDDNYLALTIGHLLNFLI